MDLAERYLYLRSMPGGPNYSDEGLLPLAERAEEVLFAPGTTILARDALPDTVYFTMQGTVELRGARGKQGQVEAPGAVGVLAIMGDCELPYDAVARDEVVALAIDAEFFRETFEDNFDRTLEIIAVLARHLVARRKVLPARMAPALDLPPNVLRAGSFGLVERMLIVRRFDIFGPGALSGLTEVAQQFDEIVLAAGQELFAAGSHADAFHLLVDGEIEFEWPDGNEVVERGPLFSNLETFATLRHGAAARAVGDARILSVPWETLVDVLEDHNDMALTILARLAQAVIRFAGSVIAPGDQPPLAPPTPAGPTHVVGRHPVPTSLPDELPAAGTE